MSNVRIKVVDALPEAERGGVHRWKQAVQDFQASGAKMVEVVGEPDSRKASNGLRGYIRKAGIKKVKVVRRGDRTFLVKA